MTNEHESNPPAASGPLGVRHHRTPAVVGIVVGVVLVATIVGYQWAATPTRPNVQSAAPADVVSYVSHDRGLASLAQIEQEQFMKAWQGRIMADAAYQESLREALRALNEEDRKRFVNAIIRVMKRNFLDDAKRYAALGQQERFAFVRERLVEYAAQAPMLKDLTRDTGFRRDLPGGQDEVRQWLMENTTAEERAIGEPYVDALKHVSEQDKKQKKG
jgi:hypothetical protein